MKLFISRVTVRHVATALWLTLTIYLTGCFSGESLDAYNGTLTKFFPPTLGDYKLVGEVSVIPSTNFKPEVAKTIRNGSNATYRRDNAGGPNSFIKLNAYGLYSSDQAKAFVALLKDGYVQQNYAIKEEAPRTRPSAEGERIVMVLEPGGDRKRETLILWRNGAVVFSGSSMDGDQLNQLAQFEADYPY